MLPKPRSRFCSLLVSGIGGRDKAILTSWDTPHSPQLKGVAQCTDAAGKLRGAKKIFGEGRYGYRTNPSGHGRDVRSDRRHRLKVHIALQFLALDTRRNVEDNDARLHHATGDLEMRTADRTHQDIGFPDELVLHLVRHVLMRPDCR